MHLCNNSGIYRYTQKHAQCAPVIEQRNRNNVNYTYIVYACNMGAHVYSRYINTLDRTCVGKSNYKFLVPGCRNYKIFQYIMCYSFIHTHILFWKMYAHITLEYTYTIKYIIKTPLHNETISIKIGWFFFIFCYNVHFEYARHPW